MRLTINLDFTYEDAVYVSKRVQKEETLSLSSINCSPVQSCLEGIEKSEYVGTVNTESGKPIAFVGIAEMENNVGVVWSMTSNDVARYPISFVKIVKELIRQYGGLYDKLISYALVDNPLHQKFHHAVGMYPTNEIVRLHETGLNYLIFENDTVKGLNKMYYEG